jgi:hypothetical protein
MEMARGNSRGWKVTFRSKGNGEQDFPLPGRRDSYSFSYSYSYSYSSSCSFS